MEVMFWLRIITAIWCIACVLGGRIPVYDYSDLDDDFYSELRNLLDGNVERKIKQQSDWNRAHRVSHPREVKGWGSMLKLGQVSGVSVDPEGHPVVFHRASRKWDHTTFNSTHHFQGQGPIEEDVVMVLDPQTGDVVKSWGKDLFYLPHGITVDQKGNTWLTDVALHQVFKFAPGSEKPELTLGEAKIPGSDDVHMCKPTSVAVSSTGDFYVADGYCNARVLRFDVDGKLVGKFGHPGMDGSSDAMFVPHGVALEESRDVLCIADRENKRVVCVKAGLQNKEDFGHAVLRLEDPNHGRVFDVAVLNEFLVGVGGSSSDGAATGFTADLDAGILLDAWGPVHGFQNPHAIAVTPDATTIYVTEIGPNRVWKFLLENPAEY